MTDALALYRLEVGDELKARNEFLLFLTHSYVNALPNASNVAQLYADYCGKWDEALLLSNQKAKSSWEKYVSIHGYPPSSELPRELVDIPQKMQAPPKISGRTESKGAAWPFILGFLIAISGLTLGFTIPVGTMCGAAFSGNHTEAAGYDMASAFAGRITHAVDACDAAAPAQVGIYLAIIGFGLAIIILGVVLNSVRKPAPDLPQTTKPRLQVSGELIRLVALRDQGDISAQEFDMLKNNLLAAADKR